MAVWALMPGKKEGAVENKDMLHKSCGQRDIVRTVSRAAETRLAAERALVNAPHHASVRFGASQLKMAATRSAGVRNTQMIAYSQWVVAAVSSGTAWIHLNEPLLVGEHLS